MACGFGRGKRALPMAVWVNSAGIKGSHGLWRWEIAEFQQRCGEGSKWLFDIVERYGGSVSAEHGFGLLKKESLHYSRSELEVPIMRQIKKVFDPQGIVNPGRISFWQAR